MLERFKKNQISINDMKSIKGGDAEAACRAQIEYMCELANGNTTSDDYHACVRDFFSQDRLCLP